MAGITTVGACTGGRHHPREHRKPPSHPDRTRRHTPLTTHEAVRIITCSPGHRPMHRRAPREPRGAAHTISHEPRQPETLWELDLIEGLVAPHDPQAVHGAPSNARAIINLITCVARV